MVLAEYDLSACAVQNAKLSSESPGSTSLVSRWTPTYPLRARYLPLDVLELQPFQFMLFPLASVFGPGSCRRRHQTTTATSIFTKTTRHRGPHREVEHFLRDRHLVNGCQRHVGLLPSRSWVSQSTRQKLPLRTEGSAVTVAFRETTIFVSSVFTHVA